MSGNEAKTRKDIIYKCLQFAGCNVNDHSQVIEEFDNDVQVWSGVLGNKKCSNQFQINVFLVESEKPQVKNHLEKITTASCNKAGII